MHPITLLMPLIITNYFDTQEYQEICLIIQFIVYKDVDSKHFADKKLKYDIKTIHRNLFNFLKNKSKSDLHEFVQENFQDEDDFLNVPKIDKVDLPSFFYELDDKIRDVFETVHNLWYKYARRDILSDSNEKTDNSLNNEKSDNNKSSSEKSDNSNNFNNEKSDNNNLNNEKSDNESYINNKLFLPHTYFVPGGRFRELYYWDCNWILLGLLSSGMTNNSFELVLSLTYLINKYGYIPNGSREYYLGRSQPPFYGQMLYRLYRENIQREWILSEGLEALEKEYDWWMTNRSFDEGYRLNRYKVNINHPRPESFKEDYFLKESYSDIWSGAESGWDFSSRWYNTEEVGNIYTGDIIPVDLNIYLLIVEEIIFKFYTIISNNRDKLNINILDTNQNDKLKHNREDNIDDNDKFNEDFLEKKLNTYSKYIRDRKSDINNILWNKDKNIWNDYNTKTNKYTDKVFYFSNITPLFVNLEIPNKEINIYNILNMYKKHLFGYPGGIPVSGSSKGNQQWDFPNVWAPLVQMFIEFVGEIEPEMGLHVARSFFDSVYKGMGSNKQFHEKYDCKRVGINGKGGEYNPQEGFGWTNGTVAWIIKMYKNDLIKEVKQEDSYEKICEIIKKKMK